MNRRRNLLRLSGAEERVWELVSSLRDSFRLPTPTRHLRAGLSYATPSGWNSAIPIHLFAQNPVLAHPLKPASILDALRGPFGFAQGRPVRFAQGRRLKRRSSTCCTLSRRFPQALKLRPWTDTCLETKILQIAGLRRLVEPGILKTLAIRLG
jgi:hypothetical protein